MSHNDTTLSTRDSDSAQFGSAAHGNLVLASIAFGGGMPCLAEKYLFDAVLAFEEEAYNGHRQRS